MNSGANSSRRHFTGAVLLLVNSAEVTYPAAGNFGLTTPIDIVESVNVLKTPYLAQFGRFTAGLVSIETRRGGDGWHFDVIY